MYCTKKITDDLIWVGANDRRFQFGQIPVLMLPAADLQNILFFHKGSSSAKFSCHHDNTAKLSCQPVPAKLRRAADCRLILAGRYGIMPQI